MTNYTLTEDPISIRIQHGDTTLNLNKNNGLGLYTTDLNVSPKFKTRNIDGILGLIRLKKYSYLIIIKKSKLVGTIFGSDVYHIEETGFVVFETINTKESDTYELKALNEFMNMKGLYYSEYPLYKSYADRNVKEYDFLFNKTLLNNFETIVRGDTSNFTKKIFQGYFNIVKSDFEYALISRRSWKRAGMRLFSRGSDNNGFVSNYVETEQLVIDGDNVISFLQARGSIPLKWRHIASMKLNPPMIIDNKDVIVKADKLFRDHYHDIFYLNLIQHKNYENKLNSAYRKEMKKHNLENLSFDFKNKNVEHCIEKRNEFVSGLVQFLEKHGMTNGDISEQKGIIRTNCIDCLDRTNVVQYLIAKEAIKEQLKMINKDIGQMGEYANKFWYENGNNISLQYSGTPSLKSTIILGGNQTFRGLMRDGYHSGKRYFLNRFYDGRLHDGYQLFTGNYKNMVMKRRFKISIKMYLFIFILINLMLYSIDKNYKGLMKSRNITVGVWVGFITFYVMFFDRFLLFPRYNDE